jgi:adenylate cyclase
MREITKRRLRTVLWIAIAAAIGSAIYGYFGSDERPLGAIRGAVIGALIATTLALFETFFVTGPGGTALRRLPFAVMLAVSMVFYLAVFTAGLRIGPLIVSLWIPGDPYEGQNFVGGLVFSGAFSLVFLFILQVDRMLGQGELWRFVRGRYYRPREEERIFLFLDLVGSTAIAERIGGVRFLGMLNRLYDEISVTIAEHRGEIHKYVGDEVIITWTPDKGLPGAQALACALAIEREIATRAERYRRDFDVAPSFRAGLHLGPVVSGELGSAKREIAYLGDTVNTTSRLVEACRSLGRSCIASETLVARVLLPGSMRTEPLGVVPLRGKEQPLALFSVSPTDG